MANETTKKKKTTKTSKQVESAVVAPVAEEVAEVKAPVPVRRPTPKEVDITQIVYVRNGYQGRLIYKSPRTGEKFVWTEFGEDLPIELRDLISAKTRYKKFFENNHFMFDEEYEWVIDYLGMSRYYKNAIKLDEFDELFKKSPAEIEDAVGNLSKGQKRTVSYRARMLIADGEIDSNKAIAALEKSLGVELVER